MVRYCCIWLVIVSICGCSAPPPAAKKPAPAPAEQLPVYSAQSIVPVEAREPAPLAPGMVAVVYGQHLGPNSPCDGIGDPTLLCGSEVHVAGKAAGLLYVSDRQINFRVPRDVAPAEMVDVRIAYNGSAGREAIVPFRAAAVPGTAVEIAERMWREFRAVAWDAPYRRGCAAVAPHQTLRGGLHDYAFYCVRDAGPVMAESFYYPVAGEPPQLQLRRADFRMVDNYPELGVEVERLLIEKLTRVYGTGSVPGHLFEIGVSRPHPGLSWQTDKATVFLHRNRMYVAPVGVREGVSLIAVHREVLAGREASTESHGMSFWWPQTEAQRTAAVPVTRDGLMMLLLRESDNGDRNRRAGNLVAADNLVVQLGILLMTPSGEASNAAVIKRQLARHGIRYTGVGHYSGALEYDRSLLLRAWKEFPDTQWGQRAFLMLQRLSCSIQSYGCDGPNCFLKVIADGEKFLRDYPDTQFRTRQLYQIGLAHETWWSLSNADPADISGQGAKVTKTSGERARLRAIELYEEVIRSAPDSTEARAAARALPRLKLKLSTGERTFFCFSC